MDGEQDVAALQEQLAEARARAERLERQAAEAAALRAEVKSARDEATTLRGQVEASQARERADAARYRELVMRADPSLPEELIAGENVEAVEASVLAAREVVGRVRSHIEAQAQSSRVPAGAPARGAPDVSSLTPEQKIRFGLERQSQ